LVAGLWLTLVFVIKTVNKLSYLTAIASGREIR
jgi:hypothetical protein